MSHQKLYYNLNNFKNFTKNYLNLIKVDKKKIGKSDIVENEKICVINIYINENDYNKAHNKLASSCNIKGLPKILLNKDSNNNEDDNTFIKSFNILTFEEETCFINILVKEEMINNVTENNFFPYNSLHSPIVKKIASYTNNAIILNVIFDINSLSEENYYLQLASVVIYFGYYIQYINENTDNNNSNKKFKFIKIKSNDNIKLEESVTFLDKYCAQFYSSDSANINCKEIIKCIKEKQIIEQNIKDRFGGIKLNVILHKKNINNVSKNRMQNTQNYLSKYLKNCYNDDDNLAYDQFGETLDILKLLCDKTTDSPPLQVGLEKLQKILIQTSEDEEEEDSDEYFKFIFANDQDNSERYVSKKFLEAASDEFIEIIFKDLFFHSINKIKEENTIKMKINTVDISLKNNKKLISKIYFAISNILSKHYIVNEPQINNENNNILYTFESIKKPLNKKNNIKRKLEENEKEEEEEEEEEEESDNNYYSTDDDDEEEEEEEYKQAKKRAKQIIREKDKKSTTPQTRKNLQLDEKKKSHLDKKRKTEKKISK